MGGSAIDGTPLFDPRISDELMEYSIDSFLRGDYDRNFADNAAAPLPNLSPSDTVDAALRSLRDLDEPEPSHGAAVFLRFCVQLGRGERWGVITGAAADGGDNNRRENNGNGNAWKELLRGALTPTMLARRLRSSEEFSSLLEWKKLDVTDGVSHDCNIAFVESNIAFVNAALYFDDRNNEDDVAVDDDDRFIGGGGNGNVRRSPPEILQFKLMKPFGVWLIDSVQRSPASLFRNDDDSSSSNDNNAGGSNNSPNKERRRGRRRPPPRQASQGRKKRGSKKDDNDKR